MKLTTKILTTLLLFICMLAIFAYTQLAQQNEQTTKQIIANANPLPSWSDRTTKKSIIDFITKTTTKGSADFIPVADRISCFDNDGTLWSEQPMYFQLAFALDRIKALAPGYPEWKTTQPFQSVLEGNINSVLAAGEKALLQIIMATHSGMSEEAFQKIVKDWIAIAVHPIKKKHYNELVYQPMVELLNYPL